MSGDAIEDRNYARDEPEVQLSAAERLAFFTDAVVAIAITLLALDLKLPEGQTWGAIGTSVAAHADGYVAFLISFFIIGNAWLGHHALFRYITRADPVLLWTNLSWLLLIIVAPFFTRLVIDEKVYYQFRFVCYAAVQVLLGLLLLLLVRHAANAQLLTATPARLLTRLKIRSLVVAVPFTLSIVAVFIPGVGQNAFYFWLLGPPAIGLLLTLRRKWRDRRRLAVARPQDEARSV